MKGKITGLALVLLLIGIIGMLVTGKEYFTYEELSGEEKIKADSIEEILVESNVSRLEIKASMDDYIHVNWTKRASVMKDSELRTSTKDQSLMIQAREEKTFEFLSFNFPWQQSTIEILIPADKIVNLYVNNSIGEVSLASLSVEKIQIESDIADILLEDVKAQEIDLASSVGKIAIHNSEGKIFVKNDVGDILISSPKLASDISAESNVGDIRLQTKKEELQASIYSRSDLGDIKIFDRKNEDYILEDTEYVIYLKTDIGNIRVSEIE